MAVFDPEGNSIPYEGFPGAYLITACAGAARAT